MVTKLIVCHAISKRHDRRKHGLFLAKNRNILSFVWHCLNNAHKRPVNDEKHQNQSLQLIKLLGACTGFLSALCSIPLSKFYWSIGSICTFLSVTNNEHSNIIVHCPEFFSSFVLGVVC